MANQIHRWQKILSRFRLGKSERISVIVDDNPNLVWVMKKIIDKQIRRSKKEKKF
ncbi:MAG: hypothetical protein QME57_05320 [Patescibacteria group bacterium]|nr:hypothetical protein [Patescibacteria group bacterium]